MQVGIACVVLRKSIILRRNSSFAHTRYIPLQLTVVKPDASFSNLCGFVHLGTTTSNRHNVIVAQPSCNSLSFTVANALYSTKYVLEVHMNLVSLFESIYPMT